ncbi:MAG TPA: peptidylprolyl isomerase [Blastocatellia bacterium]|nr:peptidylprolyl isomerase [Blastocatellia bacterium]
MKIARIKRSVIIISLIPIIASLGFFLFTTEKSYSDSSRAAGSAPPVLATVEGREISAKLFQLYLKDTVETLGLSDKTPEGSRRVDLLKEGIIAELIDRALIEDEARRRNLSFAPGRLESERKIRIEQMGGEELYRNYLSESGLSEEEFSRIVATEIYGDLLRQDLAKDVSVTEGEARDFYNKEKSNPKFESLFVEPERVRASHILINARRAQIADELRAKGSYDRAQLDRMVADETARRRERAAAVLSSARAGADFARLARQYSDDPGTREQGGDLGLFQRSAHTPKFDDAAFALKPGQTSDIVETEYGFHIIKVAEHRAARVRGFDEVRSAIEQQALARKRAERLTRWLEERRGSAQISVTPFYRVGRFQTSGR